MTKKKTAIDKKRIYARGGKSAASFQEAFDMALRYNNEDKLERAMKTFDLIFSNRLNLSRLINDGVPIRVFDLLKQVMPFSEEEWADFLHVSIRTLQRNRQSKDFHFKPVQSERIMELAEVTKFGEEVFESSEKFYSWLNEPSFALGNQRPAELLRNSYGKELVMDELNRIEHGIFA